MDYMSEQEATQYIAGMLEAIQVLYTQAKAAADMHDIPFDITFDGGRQSDTTVNYLSWQSSSYNC